MKDILLILIRATSILLSVIIIYSCKKHLDELPESNDTYFKVIKNGNVLGDSILLKTKLFYIDANNKRISDSDQIPYNANAGSDIRDTSFVYLASAYFGDTPELQGSGIAFFRYIVSVNVDYGIHDFYLEFPDGDIDTLYLNAEKVSEKQGLKEECYCTMPIRTLKFNGKDVIQDTSTHLSIGAPVYLFEK
jgi:hypothetical protein